jgi:hypothetical protein
LHQVEQVLPAKLAAYAAPRGHRQDPRHAMTNDVRHAAQEFLARSGNTGTDALHERGIFVSSLAHRARSLASDLGVHYLARTGAPP